MRHSAPCRGTPNSLSHWAQLLPAGMRTLPAPSTPMFAQLTPMLLPLLLAIGSCSLWPSCEHLLRCTQGLGLGSSCC